MRFVRKRYLWISAIIVAVVLLAVALMWWLMQPAEGTATTKYKNSKNGIGQVELKAPQYSLKLSGTFQKLNTPNNQDKTAQFAARYASTTSGYRLFVATDRAAAKNSYEDDSTYYMRTVYPDKYTRSDVSVDGAKGVLFLAADSKEAVVYILRDKRVHAFALSSTEASSTLQSELNKILETVQWGSR